jgi:hypothetical protein
MPNKPMKEYARPHRFNGYFELNNVVTKNETAIPIFACDGGLTNPEDVHTNPTHGSWCDVITNPFCFPGAKVYKYKVELAIGIPYDNNGAFAGLAFQSMLVGNAFKDMDIISDTANSTIANILRIEKEASTENTVHPNWNGTDLDNADTFDAEMPGLTTDQTHEGINFDEELFRDEWQFGDSKGLLKKMTFGRGLRDHKVYMDRPYAESDWYKTPGYVSRMNQFTTFHMMIRLPLENTWKQFYQNEFTANSPLRVGWQITFNEYHDMFDSS